MNPPGRPDAADPRPPPEGAPVRTVASPSALQADALCAEIERLAQARRDALLDAAARDAARLRAEARDDARRQCRQALAAMRASERGRTRDLQAALETAARQQAARQAAHALALAWPQLDDALSQRWALPAARQAWVDATLALARRRLRGDAWQVAHPADFGAEASAALRAALARHGAGAATLSADAALVAGLVVQAGGARLDSSPPALCADRARVEAELLARMLPACAAGDRS